MHAAGTLRILTLGCCVSSGPADTCLSPDEAGACRVSNFAALARTHDDIGRATAFQPQILQGADGEPAERCRLFLIDQAIQLGIVTGGNNNVLIARDLREQRFACEGFHNDNSNGYRPGKYPRLLVILGEPW